MTSNKVIPVIASLCMRYYRVTNKILFMVSLKSQGKNCCLKQHKFKVIPKKIRINCLLKNLLFKKRYTKDRFRISTLFKNIRQKHRLIFNQSNFEKVFNMSKLFNNNRHCLRKDHNPAEEKASNAHYIKNLCRKR